MKPRGVILLLLLFLACVARAQNPVFLLTPGGGGASLPTQAGQSGQFLTTNGTTADWVAVPGGGDLLAANNLSDLASATTARVNLGLVIGTNVQAFDSDLTLFAAITPSANVQTFLGGADYAALRTQLGLVIGTNVQAFDADLTTYAGITPMANVQTFLAAANYGAMRTQLDLVIGTNVQAWNANLDTFALIAPAANTVTFLGAANYAAMRTQLDLALDASSFNGNLSTSDDTLQEVSQKLDDLTLGGAAPGANTNVIFNDSGVYGADADFTWDKTNNVLSVPAISVTTLNSIAFKILDAVNQSHGLSFIVSTDLTAEKTFTYTGAFNFAMTLSADTSVTFPTTGTLATLAGTETLTNKTLTSPTLTTPSLGVATATSINKVAVTAPATSATLTVADGKTLTVSQDTTLNRQASTGLPVEIQIACSDLATAITTGTSKAYFRAPYAFTLTEIRASVLTAPTGSTMLIDVNETGTTVISTKVMIDVSEKTSQTAATPYVISDSAIADDAEITIDFDQVGSTVAGAGVIVLLKGYR